MLYNDVIISPRGNDSYEVIEDFKYKDIVIPKGYTTNGADIPRIFWSLFPPNRSNYMPAVLVHDYLCDKEDYTKADEYFKEALKELNVSCLVIYCFYYSVRLYHIIKYK